MIQLLRTCRWVSFHIPFDLHIVFSLQSSPSIHNHSILFYSFYSILFFKHLHSLRNDRKLCSSWLLPSFYPCLLHHKIKNNRWIFLLCIYFIRFTLLYHNYMDRSSITFQAQKYLEFNVCFDWRRKHIRCHVICTHTRQLCAFYWTKQHGTRYCP